MSGKSALSARQLAGSLVPSLMRGCCSSCECSRVPGGLRVWCAGAPCRDCRGANAGQRGLGGWRADDPWEQPTLNRMTGGARLVRVKDCLFARPSGELGTRSSTATPPPAAPRAATGGLCMSATAPSETGRAPPRSSVAAASSHARAPQIKKKNRKSVAIVVTPYASIPHPFCLVRLSPHSRGLTDHQ